MALPCDSHNSGVNNYMLHECTCTCDSHINGYMLHECTWDSHINSYMLHKCTWDSHINCCMVLQKPTSYISKYFVTSTFIYTTKEKRACNLVSI